MGHEVTVVDDRISMGRGQIIWRGEDGVYTAGTEPRCDGRGRRVVKEVAADNNKEGAAFPVQGARLFLRACGLKRGLRSCLRDWRAPSGR